MKYPPLLTYDMEVLNIVGYDSQCTPNWKLLSTYCVLSTRLVHGHLYIWTELLPNFFGWSAHMRQELGTQITPRGWIFWTMIFYHKKIQVKIYLMRGQTLFWDHYKLVIELLKHSCFFDKLPKTTDCGFLQQSQNRARFWICKVLT